MMSFSTGEILASVIYAIAYGTLFAIAFTLIVTIKEFAVLFYDMLKSCINYEKIFPLPKFTIKKITPKISGVTSVLSIFFFAIGFSLLSYLSLDGEIRLYMLIFAFASLYLSKIAFLNFFINAFLLIFGLFNAAFSLFLRLLLWCPKRIMRKLHYIIKNKNHAHK